MIKSLKYMILWAFFTWYFPPSSLTLMQFLGVIFLYEIAKKAFGLNEQIKSTECDCAYCKTTPEYREWIKRYPPKDAKLFVACAGRPDHQ